MDRLGDILKYFRINFPVPRGVYPVNTIDIPDDFYKEGINKFGRERDSSKEDRSFWKKSNLKERHRSKII